MVALLIGLLLVMLVLGMIVSPWRWSAGNSAPREAEQLRHAATEVMELEAARDAKYREIRDAELDSETGQLSREDFQLVDTDLRAEAVEILKRLDRAEARLVKLRQANGVERVEGELPDPE
jgi:hypothetical protein